MAAKKTTTRKAERPQYDNKAVAPAPRVSSNARIKVIKAHDGLAEGSEWMKPRALAKYMQKIGYWQIIG